MARTLRRVRPGRTAALAIVLTLLLAPAAMAAPHSGSAPGDAGWWGALWSWASTVVERFGAWGTGGAPAPAAVDRDPAKAGPDLVPSGQPFHSPVLMPSAARATRQSGAPRS